MKSYEDKVYEILLKSKEKYSDDYKLFVVPMVMAKGFIAYSSMKYDLELMIKYLEKLKEERDLIIQSSLTYSIIALYGKLFTDAQKSRKPKLEADKVYSFNEDFLNFHKYLMSLRHDFIAHRGNHIDEIGVPLFAVERGNGDKGRMIYNQSKLNTFSKEKIQNLKILFEHLIRTINNKIENSARRTCNGLFKKFTKEDFEKYSLENYSLK